MQTTPKTATLVAMTTKGILIIALFFLLAVGAGFGFPLLRDRLSPDALETPAPNTPTKTESGCTEDTQCTWFTKVIENNSGQANEEVQIFTTCANSNFKESCGLDCEDRGNVHPYNKIDKCFCNQGFCESDEKAPLE